jgi:sigma-B regulation protein RsbQ
MVFLHGYACDQSMWRHIAPHFEQSHKVVLYDHVGAGSSDLRAYDKLRYATLHAYADDLIEICDELGLSDIDVMAHSVGGMISLLAAKKRPEMFGRLMMLGPSPCYIDTDDYIGGFTAEGIDELLAFLQLNHASWSAFLAPRVMGNDDRPELAAELEGFFTRSDPEIIHHFANVLFHIDHRADLAGMTAPCLIMQCQDDIVAPLEVGDYLHAHLESSQLVVLDTRGHYPQLSAPDKVVRAMKNYLNVAHRAAA